MRLRREQREESGAVPVNAKRAEDCALLPMTGLWCYPINLGTLVLGWVPLYAAMVQIGDDLNLWPCYGDQPQRQCIHSS